MLVTSWISPAVPFRCGLLHPNATSVSQEQITTTIRGGAFVVQTSSQLHFSNMTGSVWAGIFVTEQSSQPGAMGSSLGDQLHHQRRVTLSGGCNPTQATTQAVRQGCQPGGDQKVCKEWTCDPDSDRM